MNQQNSRDSNITTTSGKDDVRMTMNQYLGLKDRVTDNRLETDDFKGMEMDKISEKVDEKDLSRDDRMLEFINENGKGELGIDNVVIDKTELSKVIIVDGKDRYYFKTIKNSEGLCSNLIRLTKFTGSEILKVDEIIQNQEKPSPKKEYSTEVTLVYKFFDDKEFELLIRVDMFDEQLEVYNKCFKLEDEWLWYEDYDLEIICTENGLELGLDIDETVTVLFEMDMKYVGWYRIALHSDGSQYAGRMMGTDFFNFETKFAEILKLIKKMSDERADKFGLKPCVVCQQSGEIIIE
jgi:hypothetical protein